MAKKYLVPHIPGLLLVMCFLIIDARAASPSPGSLPKPNCPDNCGNVTIPFPFGMGRRDCFMSNWYEIECINQTLPFLKKINLQVLNISIATDRRYMFNLSEKVFTITVNFPIKFSNNSNCTNRGTSNPPPSLEGSPFAFSLYSNIFIAVGCDVNVLLKTNHYVSVGCEIECRGGNFSRHSTCSGFDNCCNTTVSFANLQTFNVDFINLNAAGISSNQQCNYASLVDVAWFDLSSRDLESMKMEGYIPVVLDWGTPNDAYVDSQGDCQPSPRFTLTSSNLTQCACGYGYEGNPYIDSGCQDADECRPGYSQHDICPGGRCVNTRGSFHCVHPGRKLKFVMIGVGSSAGALLLVLIGMWLYKKIKKRKEAKLKQKYFKRNGGLLLQQHLSLPEGNVQAGKLFNQKELQIATENFSESRIIGKGGQGTIYKGMLTDGRIVAIKKALSIDEGKVEQFINEVMILSQINHRNIVKLLGCCLETEIPLLVYEFIPNGTLYDYLHESSKDVQMSWDVRLQLAIENAGALFYLHSAASIPIYHRDIKSTNILLDEKYQAKIADFGTSRSVSLDQTHVTTLVQGTFGYLDPEYFQTNQFTDKSDVYSFGVVLVELLTGQKPISTLRSEEGRSLSAYFIFSMEDGHLFDILDSQFAKEGVEEEILLVANLAKRCLNINGRNRPTMKEVAIELERIKKLRYSPDFQENEDNCMSIQYQDISKSASARLEVGKNVSTTSDVDPLLFGRTW